MNICLIMDNPETPNHPVIGVALRKLSETHSVRLLDVRGLSNDQAIELEESHPQADIYLLKSHSPQALGVGHHLEERGALVVNNWTASLACQDRVLMTNLMNKAGLPWPQTLDFQTLDALLSQNDLLSTLSFPLIIKSWFSHRGDLVAKIDSLEELQALAPKWSLEPVVIQKFTPSDGWDIKLWMIDQQIFAARRRTPLEPKASKKDFFIPPEEVPAQWTDITREIGRVFDLKLFGIDLLIGEDGPIIVDVNGFPGFRGVPGADGALVALVERLGRERQVKV